jgi:flagellar biosynthesis/type III secretory pathway protein FliH
MTQKIVRADRRGPAVMAGPIADAHRAARSIAAQAEHAGRARALEAARAELAALRLEAERARLDALAAASEQVRELALLAAQHLVQAELALKPERIAEIVEGLLARVRRAERAVVRAHPDDMPALSRLRDEAQLAHVELEADAGLARGGCVVQTPIGTLDASLETRIEALRQALARAAKAP